MKPLLSFISGYLTTALLIILAFSTAKPLSLGEPIKFQTADGQFRYEAIPTKGKDAAALEAAYAQFLAEEGPERELL